MATIELRNLCKSFDTGKQGLGRLHPQRNTPSQPFMIKDLNLTIPDGKTMVVLGPTGCGKSTLLRLIGGLMTPDAGEILYDGVSVNHVPPGERQIGMIFQNYALYPHFTSRKNVLSYFLFRKSTPELDAMAQEKYRKTSELLGVDIEYLMEKMPAHLSGGEKQRIALGRCITRDPRLFLLDEPFSNLDQPLREKYRVQLKKLLRHFQITTIYVTHDQREALVLADLLAIMNIGTIEQIGTPQELYEKPRSMFVAEFLNFDSDTPAINVINGEVIASKLRGMVIGVRSEDIELGEGRLGPAVVASVTEMRHVPIKHTAILSLNIGGTDLYAQIPSEEMATLPDEVSLRFKRYHLFDKSTGVRLQTFPEES
ncbi:ATP-binding cassette domain-containing protein [candidate division KSB3 bacterium]|uniref:ATP-binding cassette domain-containing protein n=1 Tax=candidate division KSB3 bacterium TaxID=2044937 RepID=A0A9D5JU50_9BACT|nr:ATP-binding cassette domain-containing protein [candidate division KSB3 bacterium]MBD3324288.1 ATP-binding cassette domain-containing protein [candidate division KSB3 bacterium]